jgi:hypothetical protein
MKDEGMSNKNLLSIILQLVAWSNIFFSNQQ